MKEIDVRINNGLGLYMYIRFPQEKYTDRSDFMFQRTILHGAAYDIRHSILSAFVSGRYDRN